MADIFWPASVESVNDNKYTLSLLSSKKITNPQASRSRDFIGKEHSLHNESYYWDLYLEANDLPNCNAVEDELWNAWKSGESILIKQEQKWNNDIRHKALKKKRADEKQMLLDEQKQEEKRLKKYKQKWGESGAYDGRSNGVGIVLRAGTKITCIDTRPGRMINKEKELNDYIITNIGPGWEVEGRPRDGLKLNNEYQKFDLETFVISEGNEEGCYVAECLLIPGQFDAQQDEIDRALLQSRKEWNEKIKQNKLAGLVA
eukprot:26678_1